MSGALKQEDFDRAFEQLWQMKGRTTCQIDGWTASTKGPPFLCPVCATVTGRHATKHINGVRSPRCWHCWQDWAENALTAKQEDKR